MKKIAIITLYGETNYGNRLQNYATHLFFSSLGYKCETLVFENISEVKSSFKQYVKKCLSVTGLLKSELTRIHNFSQFTNKYIPIRRINAVYPLERLNDEYDYFLVGSDQVWNPCFGQFDLIYDKMFLMFASNEKKICIAPSFGVASIPEEWKCKFTEGLKTFKEINVRENDGIQIVRDLIGKEAKVIVDPTLLVSPIEWRRVEKKHMIGKAYDFHYFLGQKPDVTTDNYSLDINDKRSGNYYRYNPADFIGLIDGAECVFTDSFHACVFSILLGKPFCIYERNDSYSKMNSRFTSLFELFDIKYDLENPCVVFVDPKKRDAILNSKRKEIEKYYLECLC